jgi:tetratricopeptide (TPR) repeat protein
VGRQELVDELLRWCQSGDAFQIRVLAGGPGAGKTRLAVELCEHRHLHGWAAGLLTADASGHQMDALVSAPVPRLVIVDYAEARAAQLVSLLPHLHEYSSAERPVRVLLLTRSGTTTGSDWGMYLRGRSEFLDGLLEEVTDVDQLADHTLPEEQRLKLFHTARRSLSQDRATLDASDWLAESFDTPLLIVIAALLSTVQQNQATTPEELLSYLVDTHEDRYWAGAEGAPTSRSLRRRIAALSTLAGAATVTDGAVLLAALPELADAPNERRYQFAQWAAMLYPGHSFWNPIEPDLLGEYLVSTAFSSEPELIAAALDRPDPHAAVQPTTLLGRAVRTHPDIAPATGDALGRRLPHLVALAVAQTSSLRSSGVLKGENLGDAVAEVLEKVPVPLPALVESSDLLDRQNELQASLSTTVDEAVLDALLARRHGEPPGMRATALANLAVALDQIGRFDEALATSREAVDLLADLVVSDRQTYGRTYASALNNHAMRLSVANRSVEAANLIGEAIQLRAELAGEDVRLNPTLAGSLANLAVIEAALGEPYVARQHALQAVKIYREEAQGDEASRSNLADALVILADRCLRVGMVAEGRRAISEGVALHRALAAENPARHNAGLAGALVSMSAHMDTETEPSAVTCAQEAVALYRPLVATNQLRYQADLATALNNLSGTLSALGQAKSALHASAEAVEIRRVLVRTGRERHSPGLARALHNLAIDLGVNDREEEALLAAQEAADLMRGLTVMQPGCFDEEYACVLECLSVRRDEGLDHEMATATLQAAAHLRGRLKTQESETARRSLAQTLTRLRQHYVDDDRRAEAVVASQDLVDVLTPLAASNEGVRRQLARALTDLATDLFGIDDVDGALQAGDRGLKLFREIADVGDPDDSGVLAEALAQLAGALIGADLARHGQQAAHEAAALFERRAEVHHLSHRSAAQARVLQAVGALQLDDVRGAQVALASASDHLRRLLDESNEYVPAEIGLQREVDDLRRRLDRSQH